MTIKENRPRFPFFPRFQFRHKPGSLRQRLLPALIRLFLTLGILGIGAWYLFGRDRIESSEMRLHRRDVLNWRLVRNYLDGLLHAAPERIVLDISPTNYQKLICKRTRPLQQGELLSDQKNDYVGATIRHRENVIPVKIRLNEDRNDRLQPEKWPFRVLVEGTNPLLGMKEFLLLAPETHGYVNGWILQQAMRRDGVPALRYDFVDVTLNGTHLGIYAIEEHFEKVLPADSRRQAGPIVSYRDVSAIRNIGSDTAHRIDAPDGQAGESRLTAPLPDPLLSEQFQAAENLLEAFRRNRLQAHEVFDPPILSRYLALLDLFNGRCDATDEHLKLYYNPLTHRLEPIYFGAEFLGRSTVYTDGIHAENWFQDTVNLYPLFSRDAHLFGRYLRELEYISEPAYLDGLFRDIGPDLGRVMAIIHREVPSVNFDRDGFYRKQHYIQKVLTPPEVLRAYYIGAFPSGKSLILRFQVGTIRPLPVRVDGIALPNGTLLPAKPAPLLLAPRLPTEPVSLETLLVPLPETEAWSPDLLAQTKINYSLRGLEQQRQAPIEPRPPITEPDSGKRLSRIMSR